MIKLRLKDYLVAVSTLLMASVVPAAEGLKPVAACVNGVATPLAASAVMYAKKGLKPKCSANINIYYAQSPVGIVMAVNSVKGRNTYVGSSMTGKLSLHKPCVSACTESEAAAAVSDMLASGVL